MTKKSSDENDRFSVRKFLGKGGGKCNSPTITPYFFVSQEKEASHLKSKEENTSGNSATGNFQEKEKKGKSGTRLSRSGSASNRGTTPRVKPPMTKTMLQKDSTE